MPLTDEQAALLEELKGLLQGAEPGVFERLCALLVGRLVGVPLAVAQSGSQQGGDSGPAGRAGRTFRVEAKRYAENTSLSHRELQGEVDDALRRDPALEAWILAATREASEQLELVLRAKSIETGVPILVIDWKRDGFPLLAALCSASPDVVAAAIGHRAGELAQAVAELAAETLETLRREFQSWSLGFDLLHAQSVAYLRSLWNDRRASTAAFGVNASGGAARVHLRRSSVEAALDVWWAEQAPSDAPAAIHGLGGVGKTWATLSWLIEREAQLPIPIVVPSAAAPGGGAAVSAADVFALLGRTLHALTGRIRDLDHWMRRAERLLSRPPDEGPALVLWLDGLDEHPSRTWLSLIRQLQDAPFAARVRVMVTVRDFYLEHGLGGLRALVVRPTPVPVEGYDAAPGGELDQMLAAHGLAPGDLAEEILDQARVPRLFDLIISLRERLGDAGAVTIHRLLWEYGRDQAGVRVGRSFSEAEWRGWLAEIARQRLAGVEQYSIQQLSESAARRDLEPSAVTTRLSEIIDGRLTERRGQQHLLRPDIVAHALALSLLDHLQSVDEAGFDQVEAELGAWLEPIQGLDQRVEILRAAVSIFVERDGARDPEVLTALLIAWFQSRHLPATHRREIQALALDLLAPLLEALAHTVSGPQEAAAQLAIDTLRALPAQDPAISAEIGAAGRRWLSIIPRGVDPSGGEAETRRAQHFLGRVGADEPGPRRVLGLDLTFVDRASEPLSILLPELLLGRPLAGVIGALEAAAVNMSIVRSLPAWEALKWMLLLNEVDAEETSQSLRALSGEVASRQPELGVHPELPTRAAALLLWLTGEEADEFAAGELNPPLDRWAHYEDQYLPDPATAFFFPLERRHAAETLRRADIPFPRRVERLERFWGDPTFTVGDSTGAEAEAAAQAIDLAQVDAFVSPTQEDHSLESLAPALARSAPDALAHITRRMLAEASTLSPTSRYWRALRMTEQLLLAGPGTAELARELRAMPLEGDATGQSFAASRLLVLETLERPAGEQITAVMTAGLRYFFNELSDMLTPPDARTAEAALEAFANVEGNARDTLLGLISRAPLGESERLWSWVLSFAADDEQSSQGLAYRALYEADAERFGRWLLDRGWAWAAGKGYYVNHYGSWALIRAGAALEFEGVAPRLAPWTVVGAARERGADPGEIALAAEILDAVVRDTRLQPVDPGAILTVDRTEGETGPARYSVSPLDSGDGELSSESLRRSFDLEYREQIRRRALDTAVARIGAAQREGASLYLANLELADLAIVNCERSELIDRWLEGMDQQSSEFSRRVNLAEAAFLGVCEILLRERPAQGVRLWRALRATLTTRFIGIGEIDDLVHIAFRAPDSDAVLQLRAEQLSLGTANTDKALFELALAARLNGRAGWLDGQIAEDAASPHGWRQRRAIVLSGFQTPLSLDEPDAWPEGELPSSAAYLRMEAARHRLREASARTWWAQFWEAPDAEGAHAAWTLFSRTADRRAWLLLQDGVAGLAAGSSLGDRKLAHVRLNLQELKRVMKKHEERMDRRFLGRNTSQGLGPWARPGQA